MSKTLSEDDLHYAAGYFEARGTVRTTTNKVPSGGILSPERLITYRRVQVRMYCATREIGEFFIDLFGAGGVQRTTRPGPGRPRKDKKALWCFRVAGRPAVAALEQLLPYLHFRASEVETALAREAKKRAS